MSGRGWGLGVLEGERRGRGRGREGQEQGREGGEEVGEHVLTGVQVSVIAQVCLLREAARAKFALERPVGRVDVLVVPQVARRRERFRTVRALVWLLRAVRHPMVV